MGRRRGKKERSRSAPPTPSDDDFEAPTVTTTEAPDEEPRTKPGAVAVAGEDSRIHSKALASTPSYYCGDQQALDASETVDSATSRSTRPGVVAVVAGEDSQVASKSLAAAPSFYRGNANPPLLEGNCSTSTSETPGQASRPGAIAVPGTIGETQESAALKKDPRARARQERNTRNNKQATTATSPGATAITGAADGTEDSAILAKDPRARARGDRNRQDTTTTGATIIRGSDKTQESTALNKDPRARARKERRRVDDESNVTETTPTDENSTLNEKAIGLSAAASVYIDTRAPENDRGNHVLSTPEVEYGLADAGPRGGKCGELAVAMAVEDEGKLVLPGAVEYDVNPQPSFTKSPRFRRYFAVGAGLGIATIVAVVVIVLLTSGGSTTLAPSMAPSLAPSSSREGRLRETFAAAVGPGVYEQGTYQYYAAEWILNEDPRDTTSDDDINLIQRYAMALFYITTTDNEELSWRACNRPGPDDDDTCEFQFGVFTQAPPNRWLSGAHECQWAGNSCVNSQFIQALDLTAQNITGTLPTELIAVPSLQSITLSLNELSGTLPSEYASMQGLWSLDVHGNILTGPVPEAYYGATALLNLNLGDNLFEGSIGTEIGQLSNINDLHLYTNFFTGTLPTELAKLESLVVVTLHDNRFEGAIPTEFGLFGDLQKLEISANQLRGPIPSQLGKFGNIATLDLSNNELTGTIPEELFSLRVINVLLLSKNSLTGTLSNHATNLQNLQALSVNDNDLTGTIPTELASLPRLYQAWFHHNEFVGDIPIAICDLRPSPLRFLQADCFPEGAPANGCECCTSCCDRRTELCQAIEGA